MNSYRVQNKRTGEFLGLYRAWNAKEAGNQAALEFGYPIGDPELLVECVWVDPWTVVMYGSPREEMA